MSSILQSTLHLYAGWRSLLTPSGAAVLSPTAIALMGATGLYGGQQPKGDAAASDASILGDEAMHWAILRQALGETPVPEPFIS